MLMWLCGWLMAAITTATFATSGDDLVFSQPTVQCGTVYAGAPLTRRFTFQNQSSETIRITEVHTHCGCTTPKLAKLIYRPGETGTIELEVLTLTQPAGPHSFSAHIEYEAKGVAKEAEVELQALLVSELMLEPAKLVVPAGHVEQHPFTLHETRDEPITIVEARTSVPHVTARAGKPTRDSKGGWTRTIHLAVEPGLAPGKHEARLDLYTNDPRYAHLQAPFVLVNKDSDEVTRQPDSRIQCVSPIAPSLAHACVGGTGAPADESVKADHPAFTARWAINSEGVAAVRFKWIQTTECRCHRQHAARSFDESQGRKRSISLCILNLATSSRTDSDPFP